MNTPSHNLDTYRTLFLIKGILTLCASLLFVFYAGFGMIFGEMIKSTPDAPPFNPGNIFVFIGIFGFVFTVTLGILTLVATKYLRERSHYMFIFVLAIVNALTGILGILLAVFSLIELSKPEVKKVFGRV